MKKKDCEGCKKRAILGSENVCFFYNDKNLICPCSICLVKIMCTTNICDLFEEHRKRIEEMI